MPGFLSEYSTVTTVPLGERWWVKIRKHLLRGDFKAAQAALISPTMRLVDEESETTGQVDTGGYQNELVARAIVDWNLTDENDVLIPLGMVDPDKGPDATRYRAVNMLPGDVFDKLLLAIEGAAPKTAAKTKEGEEKPKDPFPGGGPEGAVAEEPVAAGVE